jgi:hypothetical protein
MEVGKDDECERYSRLLFDAQSETTLQHLIKSQLVSAPDCGLDQTEYQKTIEDLMNYSNQKKRDIYLTFKPMLEEHMRLCFEICGMDRPSRSSIRNKIFLPPHVTASIAADPSDRNIKRLCWVQFYSVFGPYKKVFEEDMAVVYEKLVMDKLNVGYLLPTTSTETTGKSKEKKGCVAQYLNRLINMYRCNIRDSMEGGALCPIKRVLSNSPRAKKQKETQNGKENDAEHDENPSQPSLLKIKTTPMTYWIGEKNNKTTVHQNDLQTRPAAPNNGRPTQENKDYDSKLTWRSVSCRQYSN